MSYVGPDPQSPTPTLPDRQLVLSCALTSEHIQRGRARFCCECPLALCIIDALKAKGLLLDLGAPVVVYPANVTVRLSDRTTYTGRVPPDALHAIGLIDLGKQTLVEPFTFTLHLVRC